MTPLRAGVFVVYVLGIAGGLWSADRSLLPDVDILPGLKVGGVPAADASEARAIILRAKDAVEKRRVRVVLASDASRVLAERTLSEWGVTVDEQATFARAKALGKQGDLLGRVEATLAARKGALDVPLVVRADAARALPALVALKEAEDVQPVSARLDLDKHAVIPEKEGAYIDAWSAIALLERAATSAEDTVALPTQAFPPRMSSEFVTSLDIGTVLGEFETFFSRGGDQAKRGKNIDMASSKLDGLILSPGEFVSFNAVVGERSEANGFQKSWEIFKGEMVEGVGGGTCQVASTFHAATFFAGLDVLERLPHSRPSAYIPMGLDSTVVFPGVDLKVRNPHPFPVVVHARTEGNKLKVELLGRAKPVTVTFGRDVVETVPYTRKVMEETWLSGKKVIVKQHGIKGYRIRRSRVLTYADGTRKVESTNDFYPPTTEIYQVPAGFDEALLPPVPAPGADEDEKPKEAPCAGDACPKKEEPKASDLVLVEAPGTHAPNGHQKNPAKSLSVRR